MRRAIVTLCLAATTVVAAPAQLPFSDDFNTDTSASYLQLAEDLFNTTPGTEDVDVTFAFDHSSFVDGSDSHTIPVAPNTPDSSQIALRLAVNVNDDNGGTGETAAVNLYPLVSGSPLVISSEANWRMTFDLYMNLGAGGTTEYVMAGVNASATFTNWGGSVAGSDGLTLANTGDGGGGEDYVLYVGQGSGSAPNSNDAPGGTLDPVALGFPNGEDNNLDPFYQALFPATNGVPTEQWVEVTVAVIDGRLRWLLNGTSILNHDIIAFSTFESGTPMLGYQDIFASVNTAPADQFALIDNLLIEEIIITSVGDYSLYH